MVGELLFVLNESKAWQEKIYVPLELWSLSKMLGGRSSHLTRGKIDLFVYS